VVIQLRDPHKYLRRLPGGDPSSVAAWIKRHLEALAMQGLAERGLYSRSRDLVRFAQWCGEHGVVIPADVTKPVLERFQRYLFHYRKKDGAPLAINRQRVWIAHLQGLFRWLARHNHILFNPASDLDLPRKQLGHLRDPLTVEEVETVLALADADTARGLRDRAMLEVLYATGIRRMELAHLAVDAVSFSRGTLFVREGKGRKDRIVPVGERALAWIQKYLDEARPAFVVDAKERALFLNRHGAGFSEEGLTSMIRAYFKKAGITKPGSCHLFRHTMATVMLDNGADVRFVQEMLGHARLDTTQVYTHVAIGKLIAIHAATHPGAKLQRRGNDTDATGDAGAGEG
jgi:integrase/recombinase XerD